MIKSSVFATGLVAMIASSAGADLLCGWTMATAVPAGTVGTSYNYGAADQGVSAAGSMLSSSHTALVTTYSSPAGNGSQYSFSSNNWTAGPGNYYQFAFDATGFSNIDVSWDQTRSGTGPAGWSMQMSGDGGATFSTLASYTVIQAGLAGTNTTSWNATTNQAGVFSNLVITPFGNGAMVVRLVAGSTTAIAGTSRIDNIVVNGTAVPAPGALALVGLAGLVSRRRR